MRTHPMSDFVLLAVCAFLVAASARADVTLAEVFSENMVLQRDVPIPVWGWANDGEKIKIAVYAKGSEALAQAETIGRDGRFLLTLDALPAGGPYTMLVEGNNLFGGRCRGGE